MANITLMGASYTDVPAVTLPQTGGGTVTFYENGGGGGSVTITDEPNATGTTCVITTSGSTPEPTPSGNWETVFENDNVGVGSNGDSTGYVYLPDLSNVSIADESEWRITIDGLAYVGTATYVSQVGAYGVWYKDANNSDTVLFYNPGYAWIGYMLYQDSGSISLKIEQPEAS